MSGTSSSMEPLLPTAPGSPVSSPAKAAATRFTCLTMSVVLAQIVCEVSKQLSNYSINYLNGGKYPVPQTIIVVVIEVMKLVVTIARAKGHIPSLSASNLRTSVKFLLPSVLYALNNNIYFIGLTLVPPPIWLILCSIRTAITASLYKFVLKRPMTRWQFVGAFCIVASIVLAKLPDLWEKSTATNALPLSAILLALIASTNSVGAAVYTETMFKSSKESFLDQQFFLYLYGMFVAGFVHLVTSPQYGVGSFIKDIDAMPSNVYYLFLAAITVGSIGGLIVATILKLLDNIVKEYSGSVANVITAIFCSFLFPDKFQFTPYIILSLGLLFAGILLYELKKAKPVHVSLEAIPELEKE